MISDGSGYVDTGGDIFDDEDEEDGDISSSKRKRKFHDSKSKSKVKRGAIENFFSAVAHKPKEEKMVTTEGDDLLESMLSEIQPVSERPAPSLRPLDDENETVAKERVPATSRNPFKRDYVDPAGTTETVLAPRPVKAVKLNRRSHNRLSANAAPPMKAQVKFECPDDVSIGVFTQSQTQSQSSVVPATPLPDDESIDIDHFDDPEPSPEPVLKNEDLDDRNLDIEQFDSQSQQNGTCQEENVKTEIAEKKAPLIAFSWDAQQPAADSTAESLALADGDVLETNEDGEKVLKMFWLDAFEDPFKHPGTVYLFGRIPLKGTKNQSASCCVMVKNIERVVYFLPRETRFVNGEETTEEVTFREVHAEIQQRFYSEFFNKTFRCRQTTKKFAMGDPTVPAEAELLEVRYPGAGKRLPAETTGETFSRVFNTTATSLELLLLERDLRGPCWIEVKLPKVSSPPITYCAHEFLTDDILAISTLKSDQLPPTVSLLAINVITVLNQHKEQEIVAMSCLADDKCCLDKPNTEPKCLRRFCVLTKPSSGPLPFDLRDQLMKQKLQPFVEVVSNERALLSYFLAKLQNLDPDILLGHDLGLDIDLLMSRLEKLKVPMWSRTSRLRRTVALQKVGLSKAAHWEQTAGRLLLSSRGSAMELVRSRSFDLTELSSRLLKTERQELLAGDVITKFASSQSLIEMIMWSWMDPWLALRIIAQLNALPLFVQITQIVGGVMSRTLMGGRAERNEFLLLHAFHRDGYVCPDKPSKKRTVQEHREDDDPEHQAHEVPAGKRKAQYAGGLVLEPKKGLYDTFVLLLDFNSLYPSIIQEYNICFTTVDQSTKQENSELDIPNVPEPGLPEGILPKEIRILVERRREVKKLMNAQGLPEWKKQQYDIRQMGLKLTANSMYGSLGAVFARFYAKPLAALVTAKGREILMHTKELVEKQGLSVIYGDTDSIMIDTKSYDLNEVKKLGTEVKKQVNKCHRLLELDMDGVYKTLLLLKKKKYAGLSVDMADEKTVRRETKGLDIVRRDWSLLAKDAGTEVLDHILAGESREELIERIHESLRNLRKRMDNGEIPTEKFLISKQLTKNPSEYADTKAQPHAAVALRLNNTGEYRFKQGDTVAYLICNDGTTNAATQRAFHESELRRNSELKIDFHYYLTQQVHPVVSRLCEPIEETDAARIAECLGLDATSFRRSMAARMATEANDEEDVLLGADVDYSHCDSFVFHCQTPGCGLEVQLRSTFDNQGLDIKIALEKCSSCQQSRLPMAAYLVNKLQLDMRTFIDKYYA
uniref:DNA polymerase n=1 Tax=Plectus sambesii TaxID=2011161 RepID=A0A914WTA6_9BILA